MSWVQVHNTCGCTRLVVSSKTSSMYRTISTSLKCHTTNKRAAWTRINTVLKVLRTEKYPPTDIARNATILKITQICNRGLAITMTLEVMAKSLWQLIKQNGK